MAWQGMAAHLGVPSGKAVKDVEALEHVEVVHRALPVQDERPAAASQHWCQLMCFPGNASAAIHCCQALQLTEGCLTRGHWQASSSTRWM